MKKSWDLGELLAIDYLKKNWYHLIETNFKFGRFWEIDLVCRKDDLVVFVEVKYRESFKFWTPEESINKQKLFKISKTIDFYCVKNKVDFEKIRFDVVSISKWETSYKLIHYKNQGIW